MMVEAVVLGYFVSNESLKRRQVGGQVKLRLRRVVHKEPDAIGKLLPLRCLVLPGIVDPILEVLFMILRPMIGARRLLVLLTTLLLHRGLGLLLGGSGLAALHRRVVVVVRHRGTLGGYDG
jgi:hypothetical protein